MVRSIVLLAVAYAPLALAADAAPTPPRDAAAAPVTPPAYVSAFVEYKPWREPALVPWKRVNEEVGRLGGHMGHLRGSVALPAGEPPKDPPGAKR